MNSLQLKNQIIEWLEAQPYWFQFAGNQILEGSEIDETLLEPSYCFFKEENRLKESENEYIPIEFNKIAFAEAAVSSNLSLREIKNIENVNALATGQSIEINENLTIVYGNNGSGKSGYIRLLNNAFNSRGDKNIFANVFSEAPAGGPPKCGFIFQSTDEPYEKSYPADKNNHEFSQFAVFDSQSVKVHLDNDNQLNFTPSGFDFFEKTLYLFDELKARLNSEITEARIKNSYTVHFLNENEISSVIQSLSAQSNETDLIRLADFTEVDIVRLEEIRTKIVELKALNIQEKIADYEKLLKELSDFMQQQQSILNLLSKEKIDYYIDLINSFHRWQAVSNEEGIKSLESYSIDQIGSQSWRDFIVAARNYADHIEHERWIEDLYPTEKDRCIFCLQPLSPNENNLINLYWQFLRSQAEKELNTIKRYIKNTIIELRNLYPVKFDETTSLYIYLDKFIPELTLKWKGIVANSENVKINIITNLKNLNIELPVNTFTENTNEFEEVSVNIQKEIDYLYIRKPDKEIATLTLQMNNLTDKSLLYKLLPQILELINKYKWAYAAENSLAAFRTNSLTAFQGLLFEQHITDAYTKTFIAECSFLNAPPFVEILQQNKKLRTFRKLSIANKAASQILSEGEQRAISLADFLTEVQLNPNNRGVIFDDPVTSLDHQRRALIAERLVKLSESKQVIIFTHDLLFVNFLKSISAGSAIHSQYHWMEKFSEFAGVVSNNNNPATEGDYKTVKFAEEAWKTSKNSPPEQREKILREGFSSLRTNYEYLIIFDLFKAVVLRFDERVSVDRLKEVVVLPEFTQKLIDKVGRLSRYIEAHLHSDTFVFTKPTSEDLRMEIDEFQKLKNELAEMRKTIIKA